MSTEPSGSPFPITPALLKRGLEPPRLNTSPLPEYGYDRLDYGMTISIERTPLGRLWLFFDRALTYFHGRAGDWVTRCDNPDAANPVWSTPVRLWHGCTLNKPTVLANGDWILPEAAYFAGAGWGCGKTVNGQS